VGAAFDRRAARADLLARGSPTAAEPLRFSAGLYRAQGALAEAITARHRRRGLSGRLEEDADQFADLVAEVGGFAAEHGPPALAQEARSRQEDDAGRTRARLLRFWSDEAEAAEGYLSRAVLRPYVEVLAFLDIAAQRRPVQGGCPFCAGRPWIAARRSHPGADAARRLLGCALCGGEWPVERIRCPACSEEEPAKLPSFQAEGYPAVRIEACETCHRYVKSIDLTVDGAAIPEVDDLLSLSMDLWAAREGFARIEPGLAGL
jgi:FdhE protein